MLLKNYYKKIYKLRQNNRVPLWAELNEIRQFYLDCPKGFVVDHIIPLGSKYVSGLHVLSNLQYLSVGDNRAKGKNFENIHVLWGKEYTKEYLKNNKSKYDWQYKKNLESTKKYAKSPKRIEYLKQYNQNPINKNRANIRNRELYHQKKDLNNVA